jgi:hypothetical protein
MCSSEDSMSRRKQTSGGQAIVMVTLALIAMCGMMGLAVDLGWSFFVQKQAQAAADGAALAAVHEAWQRLGGSISSVTCTNGGTMALYCQPAAPAPCSTIMGDMSSNLWNGCLYAINDGFTSGGLSGRQDVTIQANVTGCGLPCMPPTIPVGAIPVANIAYWATVRTVQTIPQLFSSVLGNTQGTVSAIATAAIAAESVPGSFYGLNRRGDCLTNAGGTFDCGVDMDLSGAGNVACTHMNGTPTGVTAKVCAPAGIYLASDCNGTVANQCTGSNGDAGETNDNSDTVWAEKIIKIQGSGAVNNPSLWTPTPTNSSDPSLFKDPAHNKAQPPLVPSGTMPTCGLPGGVIPVGSNLGPYQYYSYSKLGANGQPIPDGNTITINKANVTFSTAANGGSCPPGGIPSGPPAGDSFPAYIFYGGMNITNNSQTVSFGPGQYVMAGTNSTSGSVFTTTGGTITGDNGAGTMFIFTDGNYQGLSTQIAALPNSSFMPQLYQGFVDLKNTTSALYGISQNVASTTALTDFENYLFWQDRRNSTDRYDPTATPPNVIPATTPDSSQNVTATSPTIILDPGNQTMTLRGVSYQPEGAWITLQSGTANVATSHLQIITGALVNPKGGGSSAITLLGPDDPTIIFVTTLIQ